MEGWGAVCLRGRTQEMLISFIRLTRWAHHLDWTNSLGNRSGTAASGRERIVSPSIYQGAAHMRARKTAVVVWLLMAVGTAIVAVSIVALPAIEATAGKDGGKEDGTGGST